MVAESREVAQDRPVQYQPAQEELAAYIAYELLPLVREACGDGAHARWLRRLLIAEADRLCAEWNKE